MHTQAVEDYLKAVYEIGRAEGRVATSALAARLGVAPASVTGMVKKLAEMKLVKHERYYGVTLTAGGRRIAVEVIRHHRLIETYLHEALGVPWDAVHAEAEKWEHVLSEDLEARMDAALGHPTTDPHGAPIPTPTLELVEEDHPPLARLDAGQRGVVAEVSDHDPALLRYIGDLGLYPGTAFEILAGPPYSEGPVTVRLLDGPQRRKEHAVGHRAAAHIFVKGVEG
ncbi:MAG TPA: metal-dependent transcriptional regulator [Rubricoccaceae bacterium]|nr:metal-dependent transcriptional regulator [Rubricoccaceae bacterium]